MTPPASPGTAVHRYLYLVQVIMIALCLTMLAACNKYSLVDCETYDYSNCIDEEPSTGNLEIRVSITSRQPVVPIRIYEGFFPSQTLVLADTLITATRKLALPAGKRYAVVATYTRDGKSIQAVDGDEISKKSHKVCDAICWEVKDGKVDLRLSGD